MDWMGRMGSTEVGHGMIGTGFGAGNAWTGQAG